MGLEWTVTIFRLLEKMSAAMKSTRLVLTRRQTERQEWTEKHHQATVTPHHHMEDPHQVRAAVMEDIEAAQAAAVKGRLILDQKTRMMSDQR